MCTTTIKQQKLLQTASCDFDQTNEQQNEKQKENCTNCAFWAILNNTELINKSRNREELFFYIFVSLRLYIWFGQKSKHINIFLHSYVASRHCLWCRHIHSRSRAVTRANSSPVAEKCVHSIACILSQLHCVLQLAINKTFHFRFSTFFFSQSFCSSHDFHLIELICSY